MLSKIFQKPVLSFVLWGIGLVFLSLSVSNQSSAQSFTKPFLSDFKNSPFFIKAPTNPYQSIRYRPNRVREILRERGYRKIRFIDRELPVYIVEACRNRDLYRLKLNRWARVRDRQKMGACRSRFDQADRRNSRENFDYDDNKGDRTRPREQRRLRPRQIRRRLKARGFNRIRFTDRALPVYKVIACKHNRKMRLEINGRGRIVERDRIGRCNGRDAGGRERPSLREIKALMRQRGYHTIRYQDRELPRYRLSACRRGAEFQVTLNRWGDIIRRNRSGWCRNFRDQNEPRMPIVTFDDAELSASTRIDADTCQNQLDYLIDRKKIYFNIDSARVGRQSYRLIRRIAHVMKRCPTVKIEVAGHTDSVGSREYNHDLSNRRAYSVAEELSNLGVSNHRLSAKGYGEDHPVVSNETNRGKAKNRRIDFIVAWEEQDYADR